MLGALFCRLFGPVVAQASRLLFFCETIAGCRCMLHKNHRAHSQFFVNTIHPVWTPSWYCAAENHTQSACDSACRNNHQT